LFEKEFSSDTQLQQLILTLGDRASALVMAVRSEFQAPQALNSWARMGERLASILHVPVLLLIPRDLQNSESLEDAIGCTAIELFNDAIDASVELADSEPATQSAFPALIIDQLPLNENKPRQQRSRTTRVESYVRPIQGKPHPSSQGEQVLWQLLQQDPELVSLFRANWPVETTCGSKYLADLLWQQGQIVVEVDGYFWHSMASVFNSDRQRDYELQLAGFLTLRLPHDEVVANPLDALEKVRLFVHLRD
jgi:very-short-patch-repair endonuclease